MSLKIGICKNCGNAFQYSSNRKKVYCSQDCKYETQKRIKAWSAKKKREEKKRKEERSLSKELLAKVRESGLTYGQYVAQETAKSVKVERKW